MIPAFEAECVKEAEVQGVSLPSDWSVKGLLKELQEAMMDVQPAVLQTAARLHHRGLLTAVLANHWLDDSAAGDGPAHLLSLLGGRFDLVLQSCRSGHMVPEPAMFRCALKHLGVTSQQAVWLDADEEGVKAAEGVGMKAILVENLDDALKKLAHFTGVQADGAESPPPSCSPEEVSHGFVTIRPGVRTHFVEMGSGPPVLLCHGFPESWFSWRFQIPAMAAAGFRVLALDMKGFGESPRLQAMPQVTLVGHDWGGALVWNMAQYYPERVSSAEAVTRPALSTAGVCARGGLFVGLPEQIPRGCLLTEAELQYYVGQYKERGFRRPLNWYRNGEASWRWKCSQPSAKVRFS
ncbi:hypothetical protein KUCAC02_032124 [Chaenocephalus aceratus]|nr:hypothetical protein KUCAC02_032124 [Chaenocephalus aceratus]